MYMYVADRTQHYKYIESAQHYIYARFVTYSLLLHN